MNLFRRFLRDEAGATAIEYALIAAMMCAIVVAAFNILGPQIDTAFTEIGTCLANTSTCENLAN